MQHIKSLSQLWDKVLELNRKHFPDNALMPIVGGGRISNPKFMFIFINPTVRNISSNPDWSGFRAPFIGTKNIWRIFNRAGLFDNDLLQEVENSPTSWSTDFAEKVYKHLEDQSFYFTNIVKWTGHNADLPNSEKAKLFLPILKREIEIVQPQHIVTFGLIPFNHLVGEKIKLIDYYSRLQETEEFQQFEKRIGERKFNIIPCYFPVGRGDPKRAIEMLRMMNELL